MLVHLYEKYGTRKRQSHRTIHHLIRCTTGLGLATNLFNTATDRILSRTTQTLSFGATFSDSHEPITNLDYADDVVLLAELFDTLKDAVLIFSGESSKLGPAY